MAEPSVVTKLTAEEAALYDRQIRLWGLDAQNRLKNASVLLMGMSPLGAELAKNLMLAGLKSLTLVDDHSVNEMDLKMNFFLDRATSMHKNRAEASSARVQQLNPLVKVIVVQAEKSNVMKTMMELISSESYDLICCADRGINECLKISAACRQTKKPTFFTMGGVNGWFGYTFSDFGDDFEYACEEFASVIGKMDACSQKSQSIDDEICLDEPESKKVRMSADGDTIPKYASDPKRSEENQKQEKIIVRKHTSFTSFEDVFKVQNTPGEGDVKRKRARPPYPVGFYLFQVMAGFHYRFRRYPKSASKTEDAKNLRLERNTIMAQLGDMKIDIPETFANSLFDQVPAVCAIVGGVLGQEIIKAVSRKDEPINNMFFYNPFDSSGCVARIPRC